MALSHRVQRRHVSPDEEEDEDFISDDGMRFDDQHEDGDASGDGATHSGAESDVSEQGSDNEEEWNGVNGKGGDADDGKHTGTKPKKPPTGVELRNIKDATDLYRSSSFKLQVCTAQHAMCFLAESMHYSP